MPATYGRMVMRRIGRRRLVVIGVLAITPGLIALMLRLPIALVVGLQLLAIAALLTIGRRTIATMDRRMRGNEAEIHVGTILADMEQKGWRALHDIQTGHGNIDHIAIGPGGLFTIETKSRRGKVKASNVNPAWLKQAYAQRKLIERITGLKADSLLVLSHAFLDQAPYRQRGILLLPARILAGHLARRPHILSPNEVQTIHQRLVEALDGLADQSP
jgi:hypothetical protein